MMYPSSQRQGGCIPRQELKAPFEKLPVTGEAEFPDEGDIG
jgi:hypothetical protein